jgi:hypothetical protein
MVTKGVSKMRAQNVAFGLVFALASALAPAAVAQEQAGKVPTHAELYCSGTITKQSVPTDTYLITGEESEYNISFQEGNYVYINKGTAQGAKVGDEFQVVRIEDNWMGISWFRGQYWLLREMGAMWEDKGRLRIVVAQPNVSIAQIEESCDYIQRGDIVLPFAERAAPQLKPEDKFDRFAPPSGKATGLIATGKGYISQLGTNNIAYVNIGADQSVHVGDYLRIFRYQDRRRENAYQTYRMSTNVYGYGSAPGHWNWQNLPRQVIGEGIVLRTAPNSATVLITFSLREIYAGDSIEVE